MMEGGTVGFIEICNFFSAETVMTEARMEV
jgi:hypothetical protein